MNEWDLWEAMGKIGSERRLRALSPAPRRRRELLVRIADLAAVLLLLCGAAAGSYGLYRVKKAAEEGQNAPKPVHKIEAEMTASPAKFTGEIMRLTVTRTQTDQGVYAVTLSASDRTDTVHGMTLSAAIYAGETLLQTVCQADSADTKNYYFCNAAGSYSADALPADCRIVYTAQCRAFADADAPVTEIICVTEVLP